MKAIKNCKTGDIIMDSTGSKYKVLARLDSLIFRSECYNYDIVFYRPLTITEAEKEGFKVLTKEGKEPMKKKELEDLLGNVKIV